MQGIYTYIPETNHVPREYTVSAILSLLFIVFISLVPGKKLHRPNSNICKPLKNNSEVCPSNQVSAAAMTYSSEEKWRPFNCFFSRFGLRTYQHPCMFHCLIKLFKEAAFAFSVCNIFFALCLVCTACSCAVNVSLSDLTSTTIGTRLLR